MIGIARRLTALGLLLMAGLTSTACVAMVSHAKTGESLSGMEIEPVRPERKIVVSSFGTSGISAKYGTGHGITGRDSRGNLIWGQVAQYQGTQAWARSERAELASLLQELGFTDATTRSADDADYIVSGSYKLNGGTLLNMALILWDACMLMPGMVAPVPMGQHEEGELFIAIADGQGRPLVSESFPISRATVGLSLWGLLLVSDDGVDDAAARMATRMINELEVRGPVAQR